MKLMPDTARRCGLVVTPSMDGRLDVEQSTRAAARYLRICTGNSAPGLLP